ncbi:MAG: hypothetical protein LQ346_004846 [Caloplaca aetnensis]|nr:MAG: hypothetical protein LQ346_004846 [Caloplaca aetnensis]
MPSSASKLLPKEWKATLALPQSLFPNRPLLSTRQKYLDNCTQDLYRWQQATRSAELGRHGKFVLHDGPPYANGPLHIGHALNKILKDITCRFQLSLGKRVDYVPGWDCHGLPIEIKALEQQQQASSGGNGVKELSEIRNVAQRLAHNAFSAQKEAFQQWGIMADWDNAWKTMDPDFEIRQLEVFNGMLSKNLIHRKRKPVYWSHSSRTALAEAELEFRDDHESTAAYVKYPLILDKGILDAIDPLSDSALRDSVQTVHALIWTTTPWTLPANRAIAVHSDFLYIVLRSPLHGHLLVASTAMNGIEKVLPEGFTIVGDIQGNNLVGQKYWDPRSGSATLHRPILHGAFISPDTGTGLVHIAPGHGMDDYELCQRYAIDSFAPVDNAGCFVKNGLSGWALDLHGKPILDLGGKSVLHEGNTSVLEILGKTEALVKQHTYKHKYPYDWRTKQPVIIRATEQWFANISQVQPAALKSLDTVTFLPKASKARLASFVRNRTEWCISRQRSWGVPIPALYHRDTGKAVMTCLSVDHIIRQIHQHGINSWYTDKEDDPKWIHPLLTVLHGRNNLVRGKDTLDVWFDSGTSWTTMAKDGTDQNGGLADVYLEGTDQHRGWFQSSLLTYIAQQFEPSVDGGVAQACQAPFKTLITHGFVLDGDGRKMSKSIGNVISPDEIMQGTLLPVDKKKRSFAMGPDVLRLWVVGSDHTSDVRVNTTLLQTNHTQLIKYRNTFKWILGVLRDFEGPGGAVTLDFKTPNRMAVLQLRRMFDEVYKHYSNYDYHKAVAEINRYIVQDLSASFMEMAKDALYADAVRGSGRWQAQVTLLVIHQHLQTVLAPVTPLLIEETWEYTPDYIKEHSHHPLQLRWDEQRAALDGFEDPQLAKDLPMLYKAKEAINSAREKARSHGFGKLSLECFVILQVEKPAAQCFQRYFSDLATIFGVSRVDLCTRAPPLQLSDADWTFAHEFGVDGAKMTAHAYNPSKAKCIRCWKFLAPVEAKPEEALCDRCEAVVDELRHWRPDIFEDRLQEQNPVENSSISA